MSSEQWLAFLGLAFLLTITPGADTALVTRNTLARGRMAAMVTALGIGLGCLTHATLSALGLSAVLARSAAVYDAVRWVGAAYLLYVGITGLRGVLRGAGGTRVEAAARPAGAARSFGEGLLTNLLNPKVAIFYLSFLPQFVTGSDWVLGKSLELASIHVAMGIAWLSLYAWLLDSLGAWILRPRVRAYLEGVTSGVLIVFGAKLALDRAR
jgi:threonine/homoserine/homoserine lactone efflux protein